MASSFSRSSASNTSLTLGELSKDIQLASPPDDSISDLSWSPTANHLAVASWDNKLRIYDVTKNLSGEGKALIEFEAPVLGCDWSRDGQKVVGGGADKTARLLDLGSNGAQAQQVAVHDAPIRSLRFFEIPNSSAPMLVTGSWDKSVRYWDLRQSAPVATLACQDKVYSMDVKDKLLVIATAEYHINIVNLTQPTKFFKMAQSPFRFQTRVVKCFPDALGYAIGSTEGRAAFHYIEDRHLSDNYSFKCHRGTPVNNNTDIFAINAISVHPTYGSFSTAGSDGTFHYWDKDSRHRLKGFPSVGSPISATAFNKDGTIFAYGVSYDWSKGYAYNTPQHVNKVMLHRTTATECKLRAPAKKRN